MDQTQALIRLGRAQERIRDIMQNLESRNCSKHDPFWDASPAEAYDRLDIVRSHLALLYEKMSDLQDLLWADDE